MTKYVKSIKFSTSGETYMIRDAEQKLRIDTLETQVDEKANTSYVNNALAGKQETLKSGINIKTINNESLLGSGNITIGGGSGGTTNYEDLSNLPKINNVELKGNKTATDLGLATKSSVESKQDILVSGTNIKTINGESLLGSSDIEVVSSSVLNDYYTKSEADEEFLTSNDVGTMASESKDDYYTKTAADTEFLSSTDVGTMAAENKTDYYTKSEADDEFVTSNLGLENAGKYVKVGTNGEVVTETVNIPDVSNYYTKTEADNTFMKAKQEEEVELSLDFSNVGFYRKNGTKGTSESYRYTDPIDISEYSFIKISCKQNTAASPCVFFDYNMDVFTDGNVPPPSTADLDDEIVNRPLNAKYAAFTSVVSQTQFFHVKVNKTISLDKFLNDCCYLSLDGDDSNDGLTKDTPIQTINRAKEITAKTLYILSGEYENFDVNFSDFDNIIGIGNVVLMKYKQKITEATLVSGMTKVYQVPCSIKSTVGFLWQHNIADPVTLITDTEKHPYYQYKTHRLPSTRLYPAATVEEIEQETTKLMYYLDTTNDILYFSKTENSDLNNNPIIVTDSSVGYGASKNRNVEIKNINIKYCNFATKNLTGKITNVSVGMCTGSGAFKLDDTKDLFLYSCEGYACTTPSGGDGFNTHVSANYDYAKIIMFDCWGHDNSDDGESCHSNSCIIQHGGLYEYNGSGCTPASGGCGEYHNVVCRKNGDWDWTYADKTGFSAQGSVTVDGITIYSTIKCFNCVAQDNNIGFRDTNTNNSGSSCYNCISINNNTDFSSISHYGDTIV